MRKNASTVITAFLRGAKKNEKTISTDGRVLFSYAMPIAMLGANEHFGKVFIVEYADAPTATTRSQVRAVMQSVPKNDVIEVSAHELRDMAGRL